MRVADYIWRTLANWGVKHVFLVTGGGAMHLNDALGREPRINYVCNLHEQACAMAAEGYARRSGKPGIVSVTTGPGGTNALTGVMGAWLDSVPMIVISGQIKRETMITSEPNLKLRQLGDQEYNIVDAARPMTKMARTIMSVEEVPALLVEAWKTCQEGRPGPVWLDIPLDIQAAPCDLPDLQTPELLAPPCAADDQVLKIIELLKTKRRPAIIVGSGVHNAKCEKLFLEVAESLNIPVLTSISGIDLIPSAHPLFFGRPGILGDRAANFIMQNSDLFIVLGTRMGIRICGYTYETVARAATKVMVDIDEDELNKSTFRPDVKVHADVGVFLRQIKEALVHTPSSELEGQRTDWRVYCRRIKANYPIVHAEHRSRTDYVSSYVLPEAIVNYARDPITLVTANGVAYTSTFQAIPIKDNMRMFANEACASMGYGLPAAIGAAFACSGEVICLEGDGSIQMNLQELQTLISYSLPIKLFVYNNAGYLSIKTTQRAFFQGKLMGSDASSGVKLPSFEKLAAAYGLPYFKLSTNQDLPDQLPQIFATPGPVLVEVMLDPFEILEPKAASKSLADGGMVSLPLEDLAPLLPRDEFMANMLIPPCAESINT